MRHVACGAENVICVDVTPFEFPHLLKTATTLITGSGGFLLRNPGSFVEKVAQRFRESPLGAPLAAMIKRMPAVSDHERLGQLELAPQTARIRNLRSLLSHRPDHTPTFPGEHTGPVIHLLTNSLPHTNSGYSLRSHGVLTALRSVGVSALAVTRLGYPVTVGRLSRTQQELVEGIAYHRLLPWVMPNSSLSVVRHTAADLIRIARSTDAWAIHTTTPFENALAAEHAARELGIPWIYEVRGEPELTWLSRFDPATPLDVEQAAHSSLFQGRRLQETALAMRADAVVALSSVSAEQLAERGVDPEKITVIPNAVDSDLIGKSTDRDALREELGLPTGPLVGSVSAMVGYEGFDTLIESLAQLSDLTAILVGDGTELPALKQLAADCGVINRVIFPGRVPAVDAWKWYAALDVFVVPRKDTPVCRTVTPIKPLAALALGIPVVTSDLPALREVTGNLGVYAEADDPEALALAVNKALRAAPVDATDFLEQRTWDAIGQRYAEMYAELKTRISH
ncbi:GDP-mannose-dependent alpha-(1-6)-phosphatidylinositol monomannoside mannosyltransferase [Corynebacterium faecale]|nr:GDP-mannose-dependent alpha-(1-6)-phosphatidylinositol monomannoside mannosyltransferase [Corynebacterium faecale]